MSGTAEVDWGSATYVGRKWPRISTDATSQTLELGESQGYGQLKQVELPSKGKSWVTSATTAAIDLPERMVGIWAAAVEDQSRVLAYFSRPIANVALSEPTRECDQLSAIEGIFVIWASRIPKVAYTAIRERFTQLINLLRNEDDVPELKKVSLKHALQFLEKACPKRMPTFSVTAGGEFYLQWYDKPTASIAGITFRTNGQAIWSASGQSPNDPAVRDAAAGTTLTAELPAKLRPNAQWIF